VFATIQLKRVERLLFATYFALVEDQRGCYREIACLVWENEKGIVRARVSLVMVGRGFQVLWLVVIIVVTYLLRV
jgi:hypothetical protein